MKLKVLTMVASLLMMCFCLYIEANPNKPNKNEIISLDEENIRKIMSSKTNLFIFFYSAFCKYSISMTSELEVVQKFFQNFYTPDVLSLAKLNINQELDTAKKLKAEGTPRFKFYNKGNFVSEHEGARTAIGIINYMLKSINKVSTELVGETLTNAFKSTGKFHLIYYFDNNSVSKIDEFKKVVATIKDEILIGHINIDNVQNNIFKDLNNSIVLNNEHSMTLNNGEFTGLNEFIFSNLYPKVLEFDEKTSKLLSEQGQPCLFLYSTPKKYLYYQDFLTNELPNEIREKMLIFLLGNEKNEHIEGRLYSLVHASLKDFPSVKIHQFKDRLISYNMVGEINTDNIMKFVNDYFENKLEEYIPVKEPEYVEDL